MSAPKTIRFTAPASAGAGQEGAPVSIVSGYAEFVRIVDAAGGDIVVEWPDGSKWLAGEGRRTLFRPGRGVNSFLVKDFSGSSNAVVLEVSSEAETSDDRKELVGVAKVNPSRGSTGINTAVTTVGTAAVQLYGALNSRIWSVIQADIGNTSWVNITLGANATTTTGIRLQPGESYYIERFTGIASAIAGAAGQLLRFGEVRD